MPPAFIYQLFGLSVGVGLLLGGLVAIVNSWRA